MKKFLISILIGVALVFCFDNSVEAGPKQIPKVGKVNINDHPSTLEGRTVVLRWNGKPNGDKFLSRCAEKMAQQIKNVKIVKLWEVDKSTATTSKNLEISKEVAAKIAAYKPAVVIASQGDCGSCTQMLIIDQLNVELLGIPTVTITTTAFNELATSTMRGQGIQEMPFVVVEHPIAGWNLEEVRKKMDAVFPEIIKVATKWHPSTKQLTSK